MDIKPIAIYLPQFHPIAENDAWWGKGFTEWTNVSKAQPRFEGHYQPHLPADMGFYDLRLEEARLAQEALAKQYNIYGFCYYHYWFNGKRVLHEPLDRKLKNAKEDFPFMMCWANENWTRVWDGGDDDKLLEQVYSEEDDMEHIAHLIPYFKDDRYIKVNGKPVFIIYRPIFFPNIQKTIGVWREKVKEAGFEDLYIGFSKNIEHSFQPKDKGFDFAFEFQPNFFKTPLPIKSKMHKRIANKVKRMIGASKPYVPRIDYEAFSKLQMNAPFQKDVYPGITPMWDNSSRRKGLAFIIHDSTPDKYGNWLKHIKDHYPWQNNPEKFLFINAWNEWAEGNHLEPCQKWGLEYLKKTKEILRHS